MIIRAVLFDLDHTLGIDHNLEASVLEQIAKEFPYLISKDKLRASLNDFQSGKISLVKMFSSLFPDQDKIRLKTLVKEYKKKCLKKAAASFTPLPGTEKTIKTLLKKKIPLGILSNGWEELQKAKAQAIGFPGAVITSQEIGAWKPDPRSFHLALEKCDFFLSTTLFVGDSPEMDIAGAKRSGMAAGWLNPENKPFPVKGLDPDFILNSLMDLLQILF